MERFLVSPMEEVDRGVEIGDEVIVDIVAKHHLQSHHVASLAGGSEVDGRPMVV